ncbi:MAG TPA: hypothetical protein PKZ16_02965 [bacterium]|nr:hypothetical protein [bacterium]HPL95168.1 hypothetical protein [bacterium]
MEKTQKRKVQFSFSAETVRVLFWLKQITGAASWSEVVRNALYVYWQIVKMIIAGGEIFHFDKSGKQTKLIFPNIHTNSE